MMKKSLAAARAYMFQCITNSQSIQISVCTLQFVNIAHGKVPSPSYFRRSFYLLVTWQNQILRILRIVFRSPLSRPTSSMSKVFLQQSLGWTPSAAAKS